MEKLRPTGVKKTPSSGRRGRSQRRKHYQITVAVGSTRGPKVEAVRRALGILQSRFPDFIGGDLRLIARATPSRIASTPRTAEEMMTGARNRAQELFEALSTDGDVPTLSLGLEGGIRCERQNASQIYLLESWAYATDGVEGYFGSGGCLALPEPLVEAVLERGEELGPASDELFGLRNVRSHQGTFGVLTAEVVTREDAFVRAVLHAMAPFYNASSYRVTGRAASSIES